MDKLKSFFVTTLLGGFTVILPVVILTVVLGWLFNFVRGIIGPLTKLLEANSGVQGIVADILVLAVILLACFLVGIMVKTRLGLFLFHSIENNILRVAPGYTLIKETVLQLLGSKKPPFSSVALTQVFDSKTMVTSFITDEHPDGSCTVFVPTGPNPTSGFIFHLEGKYVHPVNVSVEDAMRSVISCGAGSHKLVEKYQQKQK